MHIDQRNHGQTYKTFAATYEEAALPSGSFRYNGGRYIRRCTLKYYPNDRTAKIELPLSESAKTLDCRKVSFGPPTSISVGPPKAQPLSGDFLRKHHLCQKWVPRGAAPRSGGSLLASPTMEASDFHSVPRAGKSIDFVYRMSLFEPPMVELSGKKFTVHDSSVLGAHRADASSIELSDASLSVALLTAGQDWEHLLSERDGDTSHDEEAAATKTDPGVEMGPDGYPIVWIKLHKKQGEKITTEIKPYRASYMRAALMLACTRQEAQRQVRPIVQALLIQSNITTHHFISSHASQCSSVSCDVRERRFSEKCDERSSGFAPQTGSKTARVRHKHVKREAVDSHERFEAWHQPRRC
jgi:hypothetical protein